MRLPFSLKTLLPLALVGVIVVMVVPVPPRLLDVLLTVNITLAVLTLFRVLLVRDPLHFSVFPSLLLVTTMIRLALNVSSTRLILLEAYAGDVIQTFGSFVVGGSIIVGLVVFLILVVIQFVVVTQGAGRAAEVAARFNLDAMPGKQMAIDADLSAGIIDEKQAQDRRRRIAEEADWASALDGASKFIKGDAIAGIVIVLINLGGGFAIGLGMEGMSLDEAASTYALLTVGDGLVTQIPALLLAVSGGLLATRVNEGSDLGDLVGRQVFGSRFALRTTAVIVAALGLLPGLPIWVFTAVGGVLWYTSGQVTDDSSDATPEGKPEDAEETTVQPDRDEPQALIKSAQITPLELRLSYDSLDLIDPDRGGDLLSRVKGLREQVAGDLGLVMPQVRARDDATLEEGQYRILVNGATAGEGIVPAGKVLALPSGDPEELASLGGTKTTEPVFGLTCWWIPADRASLAAANGAAVVDRSSAIVTHLAEVVKATASQLLTPGQVIELVDAVRDEEPALADTVGSDHLPRELLQEVLERLLDERVPVRDMVTILDVLSKRARATHDVDTLVAAVRAALAGLISDRAARNGHLAVAMLDPRFEASLHERLRDVDGRQQLVANQEQMEQLRDGLRPLLEKAQSQDMPLAVTCSQQLRYPLKRVLHGYGVDVEVLAYPEISSTVKIHQLGVISQDANTHA